MTGERDFITLRDWVLSLNDKKPGRHKRKGS